MATEKQIAANRLNATRSTGPRTEAGKGRSRGNATRHGLAGGLLPVDEESRAVFEERYEEWSAEYGPRTPGEEYTYALMVGASVKFDRSIEQIEAQRLNHAARARNQWHEDRRRVADTLAEDLPRRPGLVARRLEATRQGCELLIEQWERLGAALADHGRWTEAQRSLALDLLGTPATFRDGFTRADVPEGADPLATRLALVLAEKGRLSTLIDEALDELDDLDRRTALATFSADLTDDGRLLHRYHREAFSTYLRARRELLRGAPVAASKPETTTIDLAPFPPPTTPPTRPAPPVAAEPEPEREPLPASPVEIIAEFGLSKAEEEEIIYALMRTFAREALAVGKDLPAEDAYDLAVDSRARHLLDVAARVFDQHQAEAAAGSFAGTNPIAEGSFTGTNPILELVEG